MEITKDWWEFRRNAFTLYTSEAVLDEVAQGDSEIAAQRLEILRDFPLLELNQAVQGLAAQFLTALGSESTIDSVSTLTKSTHSGIS